MVGCPPVDKKIRPCFKYRFFHLILVCIKWRIVVRAVGGGVQQTTAQVSRN